MRLFYRGETLPYVCPHCGADFPNQFSLYKHFDICQLRRDEPEDQ